MMPNPLPGNGGLHLCSKPGISGAGSLIPNVRHTRVL